MGNEEIIAEMNKVRFDCYIIQHEHQKRSIGIKRTPNGKLMFFEDVEKALDKARASGRREFICKNCADIWNVDTSDEFEAGRQSARDEVDELNRTVEFLNKLLAERATEKQEQVRKLKEVLISRLARGNKEDVDDLIDEIFPDCAELIKDKNYAHRQKILLLLSKVWEMFPDKSFEYMLGYESENKQNTTDEEFEKYLEKRMESIIPDCAEKKKTNPFSDANMWF